MAHDQHRDDRVDGAKERLAVLGPGALVGHLALVDNQPRSATCRVSSAYSVCLSLERAQFDLLFEAETPFAYEILSQLVTDLAVRLRNANDRLRDLEAMQLDEDLTVKLWSSPQAPLEGIRSVVLLAPDDDARWGSPTLVLDRAGDAE